MVFTDLSKKLWVCFSVCFLTLAFIQTTYLFAEIEHNRSAVLWLRGISKYPAESATFWSVDDGRIVREIAEFEGFNAALRWNPYHKGALRFQARLALMKGEYEEAWKLLKSQPNQTTKDQFWYLYSILALSHMEAHNQVIQLYEQKYYRLWCPEFIDAVSLAYISTGKSEDIRKAYALRPWDLYINYQLWRSSLQKGELADAIEYRIFLQNFSSQAIIVRDERMLPFLLEIVPALVEAGVWESELTERVVDYLVWQHFEKPQLESMLQELERRYPQNPNWAFALTELYQRRDGDLYLAVSKDDTVVRMSRGDILDIIVTAMDISQEDVETEELEVNLRDAPAFYRFWEIVDQSNLLLSYNKAIEGKEWTDDPQVFALGIDELYTSDTSSIRIDGIRVAKLSDRLTPRYGLKAITPVALLPGKWIAITFVYRTEGDPSATMFLGGVQQKPEVGLTSTSIWQQRTMIRCNSGSETSQLIPMIRLWSEGKVWVDEIQIMLFSFNSDQQMSCEPYDILN